MTITKWGFGMAPFKPATEQRYSACLAALLGFVTGQIDPEDLTLDAVSEVKGLANRCVRQDQWDWFTVHARFGNPSVTHLRKIATTLAQLRSSLQEGDVEATKRLRTRLQELGLAALARRFLRPASAIESWKHPREGHVYILSRRDNPTILKIGMTTRPVDARLKEINSATGVLHPWSARRVFWVSDARLAEAAIFNALKEYRLRSDREFFDVSFPKAVSTIKRVLEQSDSGEPAEGFVKWFSAERKYGFIRCSVSRDVFFHASDVVAAKVAAPLAEGDEVEFELTASPRGCIARKVRVKDPSDAPRWGRLK